MENQTLKRSKFYGRNSTLNQVDKGTIKSQIAAVREKAAADDVEFLDSDMYVDEGYSGSVLERPALDLLRKDARAGVVDKVYVYDYGRLSRDLTNLMIIKDELERHGAEVISIHERITGNPDTDRLLLQIMAAVYEYEKKKIAQRFHNGKMQKAKRGEIVGYMAPFGYDYNKKTGKFEVNKEQAAVVKSMYEWVANEGLSTFKVLQRLNKLGIKSPSGKNRWGNSSVCRILRDTTYFGKHYFNKTKSVIPDEKQVGNKYRRQKKSGRRKRPKSEWIEHEVAPIIDEEIYYKARKRIDDNRIYSPRNSKYDYLLTGLIKCSCGSSRNGDGPVGKKYYRCTSRHKEADRKNRCVVGGINVKVIDSLVWSNLSEFLQDKNRIKEHANLLIKESHTANGTSSTKKMLRSRLSKLKQAQDRLLDLYSMGDIPIHKLQEKIAENRSDITSTEKELAELSSSREEIDKIDTSQLVDTISKRIRKLDFKTKKLVVRELVSNIVATPKEVKVWGEIPTNQKVGLDVINRDSGFAQRRQVDTV